jgi:hypothetical protein
MPPLAAIERFFERLFERPSARLFRTHVQPIQIQRRIERAMESGRRAGGARTVVPNRYVVHLHPDELAGLAEVADELAAGLADEALAFARTHHYALADRPRVDLVSDPSVQRADIRVDARFTSAQPERPSIDDEGGPATGPADGAAVPRDPTATTVFTVPQGTAPSASLNVTDPDGHTRRIAIGPAGITIGRADDNGLVARDVQVSRHHGRIVGRRGTLIYEDLGSTNGSRVNGELVTEVVLGVGDRLEIGGSVLVLEGDEEPG